ncbi:MAG TPA: condensation domain-containing protein, partial [Candidatus Dormibacteraeota bacterium]
VWELFWPLLAGARLVLARPGGHQDAAYLARLVAEERITTVHFVPAMLQAFVAAPGVEACTSLRRVVASGEALPRELVRRLAERNKAPLWNLYGPTEAAVDVTFQDCRQGAGDGDDGLGGSVPIGRPISGVEIRLLDPSLRPVPVGGAGELAIGGLAPGRGYWRRPDLTAERFVPDPLSGVSGGSGGIGGPGGRLYRTGDLARFLADGSLDYLSRLDHQVKVRGVRIELGEVEAVLAAHPAVAEAVVMLRPELPGGGLAAYLVPRPQAEPGPGLDRAELRRHLAARLPEVMVPAAFVLLAALPLTPSGKADRRALPAPNAEDRGAGAGSAVRGFPPRPLGPTEELLAGIWTEVLGIDAVSIDDDFFALGGHSLLATQVLARLEKALAVELPVAALFAAPTIAALAALVEAAQRPEAAPARAAAPPLVARPAAERTAGDAGDLPLSFGQERLWFLDQLTPGGTAYNVPVAIRLRGSLDAAALAGTFGEIVRRHESLRTTFAAGDAGAWQRVGPPTFAARAALSCIDLGGLPAAARMATGIALAMAEAERPFDLARGPLLRTALVRLSGSKEAGEAGDHLLLVTMHHIVSDGWSIGILVHELGALYAAARERRPSPLAALPI